MGHSLIKLKSCERKSADLVEAELLAWSLLVDKVPFGTFSASPYVWLDCLAYVFEETSLTHRSCALKFGIVAN